MLTWLKSDVGVVLSSGRVTQWSDQSGNGNHFTAAVNAGPTVVAGAAANGGLPALRFNNDGKGLSGRGDVRVPYTVFLVARYQSLNSPRGHLLISRNIVRRLCSALLCSALLCSAVLCRAVDVRPNCVLTVFRSKTDCACCCALLSHAVVDDPAGC
jgi:hypothetical protein